MHVRAGIVVFPGSNCDRDMMHVLRDVCGVIDAHFIAHFPYSFFCIIGGFLLYLYGELSSLNNAASFAGSYYRAYSHFVIILGVYWFF